MFFLFPVMKVAEMMLVLLLELFAVNVEELPQLGRANRIVI